MRTTRLAFPVEPFLLCLPERLTRRPQSQRSIQPRECLLTLCRVGLRFGIEPIDSGSDRYLEVGKLAGADQFIELRLGPFWQGQSAFRRIRQGTHRRLVLLIDRPFIPFIKREDRTKVNGFPIAVYGKRCEGKDQ